MWPQMSTSQHSSRKRSDAAASSSRRSPLLRTHAIVRMVRGEALGLSVTSSLAIFRALAMTLSLSLSLSDLFSHQRGARYGAGPVSRVGRRAAETPPPRARVAKSACPSRVTGRSRALHRSSECAHVGTNRVRSRRSQRAASMLRTPASDLVRRDVPSSACLRSITLAFTRALAMTLSL
jgi:hypothetical protein